MTQRGGRGVPVRAALGAVRNVAIALAVLFAIGLTAISIFQERLVFAPPPIPAAQGRGATRLDFASSPDQPLFGFLIDPPNHDTRSARRFIFVLHGNGDLADSWIEWGDEVSSRTGWSVFIPEYRGYGGLPGYPTSDGAVQDARAALRFLGATYGAKAHDIVFYAHSLGTALGSQLADEAGARALILEAPMTSVLAVGQQNFGPPISWVLPLVSRIHLAPIEHVPRIRVPVWVAVGDRDAVIPPSMARLVYDSAPCKGRLLVVSGAGHNDVSTRGGDSYRQWLYAAVQQASLSRSEDTLQNGCMNPSRATH